MKPSEISRCFQGVAPTIFSTSDAQGMPNVTYVSQVYLIDDQHVALSCQFFNKTRRNLDANPRACAEVYDPITMEAYRLHLKFLRSEKSGALFDTMSLRIDAIASVTGMAGVFKLIAADVFEVVRLEKVEGFLAETGEADVEETVPTDGYRTELRGLQFVSEQINRAEDLESLLDNVLASLESYFHFEHTMVLLHEESCGRLVTMASRGYGASGVGAEIAVGEGPIGTVARERRVLRLTGLQAGLRYGRAVRREVLTEQRSGVFSPEIPLPGLCDAQSALIMPLSVGERLVGVLAAESRDAMGFGEWHEAYLDIIANQIALGIDRIVDRNEAADEARLVVRQPEAAPGPAHRRTLTYYAGDETIFVDGDYLIRNVPARILWKLLRDWKDRGRTEFSNRELRLDASLGLPEFKDNLESRLILLRHRLEEKCPDLCIKSTGRGKFALNVAAEIEMVER